MPVIGFRNSAGSQCITRTIGGIVRFAFYKDVVGLETIEHLCDKFSHSLMCTEWLPKSENARRGNFGYEMCDLDGELDTVAIEMSV